MRDSREIRVKIVEMPESIRGCTAKTDAEYLVLINSGLSIEEQWKTFDHELEHIKQNDFDSKMTASQIETLRHA